MLTYGCGMLYTMRTFIVDLAHEFPNQVTLSGYCFNHPTNSMPNNNIPKVHSIVFF